MKSVNASSKIKRRYLLVKAENRESVQKALLEGLGTLGMAKAMVVFVTVKGREKELVFSVERDALDSVRAVFELAREEIQILRVSGTIKGLED